MLTSPPVEDRSSIEPFPQQQLPEIGAQAVGADQAKELISVPLRQRHESEEVGTVNVWTERQEYLI